MTTREISNSEDILDSRDIIARIEELESLREDWQADNELPEYIDTETTTDETINQWSEEQLNKWVEWEESEEGQELKTLLKVQEQAEGYSDWRYGETLIRDSHFEDYARELAEDLGYIKRDVQWPYTCIDWERAANDLRMDYTSIDFDGVDYLMRA